MSNWVEFLTARLDEVEVATRSFLDSAGDMAEWEARIDSPDGGPDGDHQVWVAARNGATVVTGQDVSYPSALPVAQHIARLDPATVLADIASKRAVLAACEKQLTEGATGWFLAHDVITHLAGAFAWHPDYPEEGGRVERADHQDQQQRAQRHLVPDLRLSRFRGAHCRARARGDHGAAAEIITSSTIITVYPCGHSDGVSWTEPDRRFATTFADVQYGHPFKARCGNEPMREDSDGHLSWERCPGVLQFDENDDQAACDTCGAWCGRLVAHWGSSGPWEG